ncbi:MAG TPA: MATE family efflux transporter [Planctomycetota bacterium]|nr:MATE family efflux transporter [Planctomycetota bacterium]
MHPPLSAEERGRLRRDVARQAWPVVLQMLLKTLMFYVDSYMISSVGAEAMAAMGVVGPISHTLVAVLSALSVGTVATVARAWGEGDRAKQEREASTSVVLAFALGVPLTVVGLLVLPHLAELFRVPDSPAVTEMSRRFLLIEASIFLFWCLDAAATGILRAAGRTLFPMVAALGANGLNIFLNWVFIYGNLGAPRMGLAGSALATSIAFALQGVLTFGYLWTARSPIRLSIAGLRTVTRDSIARLVRVSVPAGVEPVLLQSGFLVYNKAITLLGTQAMAAHRAAITVESMTFMPAWGFAVAGSAVVGQYLGAGRPDGADAGLRECARLSTWLMSAVGVAFFFLAAPLARIFLRGPESETIVSAAAMCLAISAFEQPFMALAMALGGGLRGAGDTKSPVLVGVLGVWGIRVPLAWALAFPAGLGLNGIWITMIADWAVRTAVFSVLYRRGRWKTINL